MNDQAHQVEAIGDLYVLSTPKQLSEEYIEEVYALWRRQFPDKRLVVLPDGMTLSHVPAVSEIKELQNKVDLLLAMLADDEDLEEPKEPGTSLDTAFDESAMSVPDTL